MKIGILTHWWGEDNYGQILQMYGLYNYLQKINHEVIILRFNPYKIRPKRHFRIVQLLKIFNPKKVISYTMHKAQSLLVMKKLEKVPSRNFYRFRQKYLKLSEKEYLNLFKLEIDTQDFDAIIVGSDQVWNYFAKGEAGFPTIDTYSIRFGRSQLIRLSYAASMGFCGTEELHLLRLVENLQKFHGISVREESAKILLENQGLENVTWVPDPTLLLAANDYIKLFPSNPKPQAPFFLYIVNNKSNFSNREIIRFLKRQNQEYIFVGANRLYDKEINTFPTVEEWLRYMNNAQTIITNSFHGCVFSILFHKNFYYFPLLPNAQGHMDSRIDSLLSKLGIEGRSITTKEQLSSIITYPYKPIDWDSVDARREEFVQVGKDFLAKHLGAPTV